MAGKDLGEGLTPQEERELLEDFAQALGDNLKYSFWTTRWHRLRGRPLPPFPEFYSLRDEALRLMWVNLRRRSFKVIQNGKRG